MFNYGAIIAEVGTGFQTVLVMGLCNELNAILAVFFLLNNFMKMGPGPNFIKPVSTKTC